MMSKPKLSLRSQTSTDKIQFSRQIIASMEGNGDFPEPSPSLLALAQAADSLEATYNAAIEARTAAQQATAAQHLSESTLDKELGALAAYVETASGGDEGKILSAGMPVRAERKPIGELPAPENLQAVTSEMPGEVNLTWEPVHGAASYLVHYGADLQSDPVEWSGSDVAVKARATVAGLEAGVRMWFRVAAIGAAGQGPWSNPASARAN